MINYYFFEGQLKSYLVQFCNIFSGLKIQTGKGECDVPEFMSVPITIGSRDRVVAAIQAGNTQNRPFSLPIMAANMTGLALSQSKKGTNVMDSRTYLPAGGVFPDDLRVVKRLMPVPYNMTVDLSICTSNTSQTHQILEQLLVLFDPTLQIQTSDAAHDWTKITTVELIGISNEENYPAGTDRRIINWTLSFEIPIYIAVPADVRDELVRKIIVQIGDLDGFVVNEFNDDGELVPFADLFGRTEIDGLRFKNTASPTIPGPTVSDGPVRLASVGLWSVNGLDFSYQWTLDGVDIEPGQYNTTGSGTIEITIPNDPFFHGKSLACIVTATDGVYTTSKATNSSLINVT